MEALEVGLVLGLTQQPEAEAVLGREPDAEEEAALGVRSRAPCSTPVAGSQRCKALTLLSRLPHFLALEAR